MVINKICRKCGKGCMDEACEPLNMLLRIYAETRNKERYQLVKKLKKELSIMDAEPSKEMRKMAERIIDKFPEFQFIKDCNIKIGYIMSQERKQGAKTVYADCRKVNVVYSAYIPFDFIVTFYESNVSMLNENQQKILMKHELQHIEIGPRGPAVRPHDIEDFSNIIEDYGIKWFGLDAEVPDILEDDTNGR